ncbi:MULTISPECIES: penicillin-binding protein PBP2A [unclassified Streptococcus]|uniref:penicillin-binding protein PBP2A n=1 Tax=unclassified Streptococcus TaxID=2608887 RepID=UPI0010722D29|nr:MULTISPECIES: penicillin-binding protein PBP2A [unclassified Streptococcus]MBF0806350.1 PBP1A family penicillin-binding protein [Streptococcus sp. 19428wA2_WM07]TFU28038.1 PBP1A family penicillin-binding protein [Streptococcus sp. WM07]
MNRLKSAFEQFLQLFKATEHEDETLSNQNEGYTDPSPQESEDSENSRTATKKKSRFWTGFRRFWRRYHLTKILLILILSFSLIVGGWLFFLAKSANVDDLQNALKATTIIYDHNDDEAGSLTGRKGTYVELTAINPNLQQAVVATEDRSFYENSGINYGRFALAIVTAGRSGGGSTITQQLAKNAYLSQDQTIQRKAKEFFLALELTKAYSKEEILTMYLNNAYYGNGIWGIEDASQKYFGISASELSLDQAATLAGMLKGPELYNPLSSLENATNRRNTVLQNMVNAGYISQEEADQAAAIEMASQLSDTYAGKTDDYRYPSYFDAVIAEAEKTYGLSEEDIVNNGYRIYTELDQNYQANMQLIYDNESLFPQATDGTYAQSGSVALDPQTGGVRALVGRINSDENPEFRSFNYATQSKRSPGSTIKPIVSYTPALAAGWSINTQLNNSKKTYGDYSIDNYAGMTTTPTVPMYEALADSLNLPAVATLDELGIEKGVESAKKFGLRLASDTPTLGMALGSGFETNPLQMAQAYGAFANNGIMRDAHLITKIENASGQIIKTHKSNSTRVMSNSDADKMNQMMLGTFTNGTGIYAAPAGYTMAGKTGTMETDFNPDVSSDQWVIGYTPDVVISQWIGFPETDQEHYLTGTSSTEAATIFQSLAASVLPYTEGSNFTVQNAYAANGIAPVNLYEQEETNNSNNLNSFLNDVQNQAQTMVDQAKEALNSAQLPEKAKNLWDNFTGLFQ